MTNKEAIEELKKVDTLDMPARLCEAYYMSIKALEQEPCDDAISRQIISDYVQSHIQEINTGYGDLNKLTNEILRMIVDYIETMSSINPQEPKTGHWIDDNGIYAWCSCCKEYIYQTGEFKYCPNCGARMESEDDNT